MLMVIFSVDQNHKKLKLSEILDIEKLNKKAKNPELDVTAVSVHACAYIPNYVMLRSGGSFGIGYGPIVTATKPMTIEFVSTSNFLSQGIPYFFVV